MPHNLVSSVNLLGGINGRVKDLLRTIVRNSPTTKFQAADSTANATTTLGDSTYLTGITLSPKRKYVVRGLLALTNGTAANGVKVALTLTGTQTSAASAGLVHSYDTTNTASTFTSVALSSGTQTFADAAAGTCTYIINAQVTPQNEGILKIQFAENASGGGTAVLKKGSWLEVRELDVD